MHVRRRADHHAVKPFRLQRAGEIGKAGYLILTGDFFQQCRICVAGKRLRPARPLKAAQMPLSNTAATDDQNPGFHPRITTALPIERKLVQSGFRPLNTSPFLASRLLPLPHWIMNKALEDLQAGRDPFAAAREAEPNPEPYYQAASASVWLPILSVVFCKVIVEATKAMSGPASHWVALGAGAIAGLLLLAGLVVAIVALCGIPRHGRERILVRSLIGLSLSLLFLGVFATGIVSGFTKAWQNRTIAQSIRESSKEIATGTKRDVEQGRGISVARQQLRIEGMQHSLEAASEGASGDTALLAKASAAYLQKLQPVMKEYGDAVKSLMEPPILNLDGVERREQLQARRVLVQRFLAVNEKLAAFTANPEKRFREELEKGSVPAKTVEAALAGYRKSAASQADVAAKIRNDDRRMGNALLGMLDVLDANWGRWSYNTQKQKTIFQDDAALDKYIGYREEMEAATKEQKRLQAQFVSQASL